jgi:hypothetical protein
LGDFPNGERSRGRKSTQEEVTMGKKIYKLYMVKPRDAWYQLSSEEQASVLQKNGESLEKAGGKSIVSADCSWSSEEWMFFGLEEYPDIESEQQHVKNMNDKNLFKYMDSKAILGTEME